MPAKKDTAVADRFVYDKSGRMYENVQYDSSSHESNNDESSSSSSSSGSEDVQMVSPSPKRKQSSKKVSIQASSSDSDRHKSSPSKKISKKAPPVKRRRPSQVKEKEASSDSGSDTDPDIEDHERLKKACTELLTEEEMKKRTMGEQTKKYRQACAYKKWYEKVYVKPEEERKKPEWKKASELLTKAAAALKKFQGLEGSKPCMDVKNQDGGPKKPNPLGEHAIPKLGENGEKNFKKAMEMVQSLSPEDAQKFWEQQERNRNAKSFNELVTKRDFDLEQLRQKIKEEVKKEIMEDAPAVEDDDE